MTARQLRRRDRDSRDAGMTLVEMLVATVIFAIVLAVIASFTVTAFRTLNHENNVSTAQTQTRVAIEALDRSVRYANAITTPGIGTDGSYYVEWEIGNNGQPNTCDQWRYSPTAHVLQSRTWPAVDASVTVTPSAWLTQASYIYSTGDPFTLNTQSAAATHQSLQVGFSAEGRATTEGQGMPAIASQVTLTADNTTTDQPLANICTQVGRP